VTNIVAIFVVALTFIPILLAHQLTRDTSEIAGGGK
jgi:putative spermidine/putrescine transport system permease protein